jgi:hypothetical protein
MRELLLRLEGADTAQVNLPLDKRGGGSLDAQIDRWKAEGRAAAKAAGRDANARRKAAKALVDQMPEAQLARLAAGAQMTVAQAKKKLLGMARFEPDKVLALAGPPA